MNDVEIHPDERMTLACPECDAGGHSWRRTDGSYRCKNCGHEYDDPVERPYKVDRVPTVDRPTNGLAVELDRMDPDEIGGEVP